MTTAARLKALQTWLQREACDGRLMKSPAASGLVQDAIKAVPRVYVGFTPTRPDVTGLKPPEPVNDVPGIIVMFGQGFAERMQEQRFDRYSGIHRPKELGGTLPVAMLFKVYEPGERLEGFAEDPTPEKLMEATEAGLFQVTDWMDEVKAKLMSLVSIPGSDLFLWKDTLQYSPYTEMGQIADKRPFYYGFINCEFGLYTDRAPNLDVNNLLD